MEIQNRFKIVKNEVSANENQTDSSTVTRAGTTALFMAPESKIDNQTSGKNIIKVTSKVGMYAMGIIIFEIDCKIYWKMKDDRERIIFINDLKKEGKLPNGFEDPHVASIIRCLINPWLGQRYLAPELLNDVEITVHDIWNTTARSHSRTVICSKWNRLLWLFHLRCAHAGWLRA